MSFILDALRKSENERQRQAGPALAEIPVARPVTRRPPVVGIAIGALVLVNLAVLGYFLLRSPAPAPAAAAPAAPVATAAAPATPAVSAPLAAETTRELRPLAGEAAADYDEAPPAQYAPPAAPDPSLLPPPRPATRAPPARPATASDDFVPTINDLTPQATAGLPTLNLDLHVYATDPAQRFVFINNRRYLEGATMPEGVRVERITRDGVVLQWRGMQFLLPRQ